MFRFRSFLASGLCAGALITTPLHAEQPTPSDDQVIVRSLANIERQGGTVDIERADGVSVSSLAAESEKVKDEEIRSLSFRDLKGLKAALNNAAQLKNLQHLSINFCWTGVKTLSKDEMTRIGSISGLETLRLEAVEVAAADLGLLASAKGIATVEFVGRVALREAHLAQLAKVEGLKTLDVSRLTKVPAVAITSFEKARPDVTVKKAAPRNGK